MFSQLNRVFDPTFVLAIIMFIVLIIRPPLYKYELLSKRQKENDPVKKYGIDVSHYQGDIEWSLVKSDISFVFVKATDGDSFVDPRYTENSKDLLSEEITSGAYHFYRPGDDPIKQATHFVNTSKKSGHQLRPVLDIEITDGVSAKDISSGALKWLKYVEEKMNCKPMIYTFASYWDDNLGETFNDYDFWLANWSSEPTPPKKRSNWLLWQFTNKGVISGIDSAVDRSLFDGGKANFKKLHCS